MSYYGADGGWLTDNVKFSVRAEYGMYKVSLPHQCNDYGITCREDRAAAIADLRALIADAEEAIKRLERVQMQGELPE